jgi:NADPH-dependent 2,4-dienoyl-CoA reductase/sulfur reductase-like enzyme
MPGPALAEMNFFNTQLLRGDLTKLGVKNIPGARITGLTKGGAEVIYNNGRKEILKADHVVLAWGAKPNREIADAVTQSIPAGKEVYVIGDCVTPRNGYRAIQDGFRIGFNI